MNILVTRAESLAGDVGAAELSRTFDHAVAKFVGLLGTVPDLRSGTLAPEDLARLSELANGIIELIENRLDSHHDRRAMQVTLSSAIYRIREKLEAIDLWQRHFISSPPADQRERTTRKGF